MSAAPVAPRPVATCITPSGRPASRMHSCISEVEKGVISDGLKMTALPAASAAMPSPKQFVSG